jgi:hypothetical protein
MVRPKKSEKGYPNVRKMDVAGPKPQRQLADAW